MKIKHTKQVIDHMERCYSVNRLNIDEKDYYIVASERIDGDSYMYPSDNSSEKQVVWKDKGGTMSIVPIPHKNDKELLAIQNFFPGFNAYDSNIVHLEYSDGKWLQSEVFKLPYCHRFELVEWNGELYIVAATLCAWKNEREDWSSPGHLYVGKYNPKNREITNMKILISNLTQNHGMLKRSDEESEDVLVSTYEGVFRVYFSEENGAVEYEHILEEPSSETIVIDINQDGEDEFIIVEGFHGNTLAIYNKTGELLERIERNTNFLHSLWSGYINDIPVYICGGRRIDSDIYLGYFDTKTQKYKEYLIDRDNGSANIHVKVEGNNMEILSANNSLAEIAVYTLTFDFD